MAVKAKYTKQQVEEARYHGVPVDDFLAILEEAWNVKCGPIPGEGERPSPTTFRSTIDGQLWKVHFFHDGCVCMIAKVQGD